MFSGKKVSAVDLKEIWKSLTSHYSDDQQLINKLWIEIEHAHTAKGRHYHNLDHLAYMVDLALKFKEALEDLDMVLFSIFYHDFVYNAKKTDNEQKSAEVATQKLSLLNVPETKTMCCQKQILATKKHELAVDQDTNYLLDFDLAILGDSEENYKSYTRKVRDEYAMYPDFMYKMGRKKVLKHFLEMDRIFNTQAFYESHEERARLNLQTELDSF
jgi:predicted metal-dependent HD superfamily phosphohydrolase